MVCTMWWVAFSLFEGDNINGWDACYARRMVAITRWIWRITSVESVFFATRPYSVNWNVATQDRFRYFFKPWSLLLLVSVLPTESIPQKGVQTGFVQDGQMDIVFRWLLRSTVGPPSLLDWNVDTNPVNWSQLLAEAPPDPPSSSRLPPLPKHTWALDFLRPSCQSCAWRLPSKTVRATNRRGKRCGGRKKNINHFSICTIIFFCLP